MNRVLVVDDSLYSRMKIKEILTKGGYQVVAEACDGDDAYLKYQSLLPDIVTMDIAMPNTDGIAAVKKIVGTYPDACIVMLSAIDQKKVIFDAIKSGATNYITKPPKEDNLLSAVRLAVLEKEAQANIRS